MCRCYQIETYGRFIEMTIRLRSSFQVFLILRMQAILLKLPVL